MSSHFSCGEFFHMIICYVEYLSTWQILFPRVPPVVPVTNMRYGKGNPFWMDLPLYNMLLPDSKAKRQIIASEVSDPPLLQSAPFWTLKLADPKLSLISHISKSPGLCWSLILYCPHNQTSHSLSGLLALTDIFRMMIWRDWYLLQVPDTLCKAFLQRAFEQSSKREALLRKVCCYVFLPTFHFSRFLLLATGGHH